MTGAWNPARASSPDEGRETVDFELCYIAPTGDAIVLLRGTISQQLLPNMALKLAELEVYIPGLRIVTCGHELTTLTFKDKSCTLGGEPAHYYLTDIDHN